MNRYETQVEIAKKKVMHSCKWYSIKALADFSSVGNEWYLGLWLGRDTCFGVEFCGVKFYPEYIFDNPVYLTFNSIIYQIMRILKEKKDSWGLAFWFAGANGWLDGDSPQSILINKQYDRYDSLIEAAKEEIRGITHG